MSYIICIETATEICSVALSRNGECLKVIESASMNNHSQSLLPFIDRIISETNISLLDINAIAVSEGPGSYTGLRIGVSTAKGLCFALNIPLISIATLQAIAFGAVKENNESTTLICPMIDARRMEVYYAIYDKNGKIVQNVNNYIVDEFSFDDILKKEQMLFCGNAVPKVEKVIGYQKNAKFSTVVCSAENLSKLAYDKYVNQDFVDVAYFEPFYLKAFQSKVSKVKGLF